MASPQPDKFIRISNELWDEVIRSDFSKRQKDIILFIWRLSYGCQKRWAVIPMLKDFELCGVPATQIKSELEYLEQCCVLKWDRENKMFEILKNYDEWRINPVRNWKKNRFKELISTNLFTSQNMNFDFTKHEVSEDETSQNMKSELHETLSDDFTKHEVESGEIPCDSKAENGSKDIIKDSIKNSSSSNGTTSINENAAAAAVGSHDFSFQRIYQIFEEHFTEDGKVTQLEVEDLSDQFETYGGEWLLGAMREAVRHKRRTLAYINGVLNGYRKRGGPGRDLERQGAPPEESIFDENDPITIMMLEEDRKKLGTAHQST